MTGYADMILSGAPSTIDVGGVPYECDTSHRTWLRISLMLEDRGVDERIKAYLLGRNAFPSHVDAHGNVPRELTSPEAVEACARFLSCGRSQKGRSARHGEPERVFSWSDDAPRIVADFQRFYGIDLTDPATVLHWWRFMALFDGLGDGSATMRVVGYRTAKPPKGASEEERRRIADLRRRYALDPLDLAEYKSQQDEMWGVT